MLGKYRCDSYISSKTGISDTVHTIIINVVVLIIVWLLEHVHRDLLAFIQRIIFVHAGKPTVRKYSNNIESNAIVISSLIPQHCLLMHLMTSRFPGCSTMSQMGVSPTMVGNFPWDANLHDSLGSHKKFYPWKIMPVQKHMKLFK